MSPSPSVAHRVRLNRCVVIALAAHCFSIGDFHVLGISSPSRSLLLRYATPWIDRLGPGVGGAIVRIMGFLILVSIGVGLSSTGAHSALATTRLVPTRTSRARLLKDATPTTLGH